MNIGSVLYNTSMRLADILFIVLPIIFVILFLNRKKSSDLSNEETLNESVTENTDVYNTKDTDTYNNEFVRKDTETKSKYINYIALAVVILSVISAAIVYINNNKEKTTSDNIKGICYYNDDMYKNEYFGFGCTLEDWIFKNSQELNEKSELVDEYKDVIFDDELENSTGSPQNWLVLSATDDNGSYVNINITKGNFPDNYMTDSYYKEALDSIVEIFKNNSTVRYSKRSQKRLGNRMRHCIICETVDEALVTSFVIIKEKYCATITISAEDDDEISDICDMFFWID